MTALISLALVPNLPKTAPRRKRQNKCQRDYKSKYITEAVRNGRFGANTDLRTIQIYIYGNDPQIRTVDAFITPMS